MTTALHPTPAAPGTTEAAAAPDASAWLDAGQQQSWRSLIEMINLLTDTLDRELQAESGMPMSYYEILVRLSEEPEHKLRMSELARTSQSSRSRLSHAVARLEDAGWVRREACPTDRRGSFAVLTEEGRAALSAAAPGHVASVRRHVLDRLTPEQFAVLGDLSAVILTPLAEALPGGLAGCPAKQVARAAAAGRSGATA